MRSLLPYIFWPWFAISCAVLLHRRFSTGSFRPPSPERDETSIASGRDGTPTWPDRAFADGDDLAAVPTGPAVAPRADRDPAGAGERAVDGPAPAATSVAVGAASLAEALEGIAMPCELTPLVGAGTVDPRRAAFHTQGVEPAAVGEALADELERLGYAITPADERSIRADRGSVEVRARLVSAELDSPEVMAELHPSAPDGALVVELELS